MKNKWEDTQIVSGKAGSTNKLKSPIDLTSVLNSLDGLNICIVDTTGRIIRVNDGWKQFAKENGGDLTRVSEGANYLQICQSAKGNDTTIGKQFGGQLKDVLSGKKAPVSITYPCHSPNDERWFTGRLIPVDMNNSTYCIIVHENVTDQIRAEREVSLLLELFHGIAQSKDFNTALKLTIGKLCVFSDWIFGEVWIPDEQDQTLHYSGIYYCSDKKLDELGSEAKDLNLSLGTGLPGKVWKNKKAVWLPDLKKPENDFLRHGLAKNLGIRSALGIPIEVKGNIEMVLLFFSDSKRPEDGHIKKLFTSVGAQLGLLLGQKQSREEVARNEELFRSIVQDQTEMIVRWKPGGIRTFVNEAYAKTFGIAEDKLIGSSFYPLVQVEDLLPIEERIKQLTPENPSSTAVHRVTLPDGKTGWQEWTDRAFFDENGKIKEYQSVGRDITLEVKQRKKLAQREQMLTTIYNNTNDFMGLIKVENDGLIIESVNQPFVKINQEMGLHFEEANIVGMDIREFFSDYLTLDPDQVRERTERYENVVRTKEQITYSEETEFDDTTVYSETQLTPIMRNNKVTHILWSSRDVSHSVKHEKQLKSALKELTQLRRELEAENIYLREEIASVHNFENMVFASETFHSVLRDVIKVANTDTAVLIQGETGTGKELIARTIHDLSNRSERPMIKINCGAIPAELMESELFGYVKGAFTGAYKSKPGRFTLADRGTILLDEIGDLPKALQVKLLRVIQEQEFEPLGSAETKKVNVRLIASTNRDLEGEVQGGNFREDLYFRLNVFPIRVPPLRERPEDIPVLVKFFVEKYASRHQKEINTITQDAMNYFQRYEWPGNIRELENIIERSVILSGSTNLEVPDFDSGKMITLDFKKLTLDEVQRRHIEMVLKSSGWKIEGKKGAATSLGLHPNTLRDRMKKLGIKRPGI